MESALLYTDSRARTCLAPPIDIGRAPAELAYLDDSERPPRTAVQPREPLIEKVKRFARSSIVGVLATAADFAVLLTCIHLLHLPDWLAKVFSLTAGTSTQFVGSRYYAFRAQHGRLGRQLKWFVVAEALAFVLTVLVFHGLVLLRVPIVIANFASGSIVYFGFSYPIWSRVFRVPPAASTVTGATSPRPQPPLDLDRAA
jgi:putative flippase GtrA